MNRRWIGALGALLVVGALALGSVGIARAWGMNGGFGPWAAGQTTTDQDAPYGPGHMMGPNGSYGPGGMMGQGGSYGPGGMMGGYGSDQQQTPTSATPVTGNAVTIQNFAFQPANLLVTVGTTVTWTNQDSAPHTVTFRDSTLQSSSTLRQGQSFSHTFASAGTFAYFCAFHPNMVATVTVVPA